MRGLLLTRFRVLYNEERDYRRAARVPQSRSTDYIAEASSANTCRSKPALLQSYTEVPREHLSLTTIMTIPMPLITLRFFDCRLR